MHNLKILPVALFALSGSVFAQQVPSAGSQLQQIPPVPVSEQASPRLEIEQGEKTVNTETDTATITVNALRVDGATIYSESDLIALTGFQPKSELSLSDLRAMAEKIADYYHDNGYFVARAYLPAQDIDNGVVTIAVIEGRYGKVILKNESSLNDDVANNMLSGLNSGDIIASEPLESRLLMLSGVPGVNVKSTLVPGATFGTSDLIVEVLPGRSISGSIDADNAGSRYTGEYRLGSTVNLNNVTGRGDVVSLRAITSGSGMNYARISYQTPVGKATVGVAYSKLNYKLGREFESLRANGTAEVASIYGSYPLIRSRNTNLSAQLAMDFRTFQDRIDSTSSVTDKKAEALTASLVGDHRDNIGRGGVTGYSVGLTTGNLDIETPSARAFDAMTAQTNGHYNKLTFSALRLQNLTEILSLYGAISGQLASKNLDVSEKLALGGMYGVRAYPVGEAYADEGYLATVEARFLLARFSEHMLGRMHFIVFADTGTVTINKDPWFVGDNRRTLSGAGIGLTWVDPGNFAIRTYYAQKLGNEVATSAPDKSGRFWIQAVKYF
ncbi:MAG: ShlB/FhaC/HecB family hemolysin secretion/activation protein [Gammaproteobacteria bacterium]|nr:ShlB/FhaC/HecB family hemolysin secretion/activation protein [Gammaproteobacteria bacterium]MBU0849608.1 ShlB/FhaC/HecB family hemolysin secretion/activation protein [Gammaproteobacteria bacterium]MBU1779371.1 ShlB/FhaC/HecB family hemolysin secretion/activation protein [Gammaproteobacteria bacterium]MBU2088271.1 ShlB/FhaC/HecB family hemolysin secretion/activation protein [Gammaproteobacteria bacterium]MBU2127552.1 ShlB/FhaC/HecB family hemolysin secretion/activation protein [Gammaproteobac